MARPGDAAVPPVPDDAWHGLPSSKEQRMPLVNVKVIEGVFGDDEKRQIVEGVTEAMVAVEGESMRGVTWVIVEEIKSGDWGMGGRPLSTEDVRALAAGTAS
jgi:4-oxalocrotonate tautomerase